MNDHYDVMVLGTDLSGLVAATLLAKRGMRVLVVDQDNSQTHYTCNGWRLPLCPEITPCLSKSHDVVQVHQELGIEQPDQDADHATTAFQAILPRHRIDIPNKDNDLIKCLTAEFPMHADETRAFIDDLFALNEEISGLLELNAPLQPTSWRGKLMAPYRFKDLREFELPFVDHPLCDQLSLENPVREIFFEGLRFMGHLSGRRVATLQAVRTLTQLLNAQMEIKEAATDNRQAFLAVAEASGVNVLPNAALSEIVIKNRRVVSITAGDQTHEADYYINNTKTAIEELIAPKQLHPRFLAEQQEVKPSTGLLTLNIVVSQEVIPNGMGAAAIVFNRTIRKQGTLSASPILIQRYAAERYRDNAFRQEPDYAVLSVACSAHINEVSRSPERTNKLCGEILGELRRLIPFLDDHIVFQSVAADTATWDRPQATTALPSPWRAHVTYETAKPPLLGITARSSRTSYKNLIHCGRDVVPGLGVEGEYIAGIGAADLIGRLGGATRTQSASNH